MRLLNMKELLCSGKNHQNLSYANLASILKWIAMFSIEFRNTDAPLVKLDVFMTFSWRKFIMILFQHVVFYTAFKQRYIFGNGSI